MKNKHYFYLGIAKNISTASYCQRKKVGAVLVKNDNIISFGYNGTISGFENVCEIDNITKSEVLHAETNALAKCCKSSYSSEGATMYVTLSPCFECAKIIIQAGIKMVVYIEDYRDKSGLELLKKAKIDVLQII